MMYPPWDVSMTDPLRFCPSTALWICAVEGWLAKETVNSVPPAKSIPSRNPFRHIEKMPGMMIRSERAKNRFRRPTKLSLRTRGSRTAAGSGSTAASAFALPSAEATPAPWSSASTSDSSDTIHSKQALAPETARRKHDREQVVRDDDR